MDIAKTRECHIVADAHYLPFQQNSFDNIHAQCVLEHLENPTLALREFIRVLKHSGTVTLIVPKPWLTNNCFSKIFKILLDPYWWLPQNIVKQIKDLRRLKKHNRFRHKSIISHTYIKQQGEILSFRILKSIKIEDLLFCSLYYFHRRGMFKKFFQFKPKVFHLMKFSLQKL